MSDEERFLQEIAADERRLEQAEALIERMGILLATFQRKYRGGLHHIGQDMELCPYGGYFGPSGPSKCSQRCEAVRTAITDAAVYLGKTETYLRMQQYNKGSKRKVKP